MTRYTQALEAETRAENALLEAQREVMDAWIEEGK